MTPEEKVERIKELFEKAVKYSEGLPPEDRNVNRTVGYYDCLVKVSGRVAELEKEVEFLNKNCDELNQKIYEGISENGSLKKEVERLKGLAMKMFADGLKAFMPMTDLEIDKCIEQFKTENNL